MDRTSLLSRIVALADCYVSLQSRIGQAAAPVSPTEALGMVMGPLAHRFEPATLWALVRSVGFYPAGQVVEMDDGEGLPSPLEIVTEGRLFGLGNPEAAHHDHAVRVVVSPPSAGNDRLRLGSTTFVVKLLVS